MRLWFPAVLLALSLFSIARASIVTSNEYGIESTPHGDISIVLAWRWALEQST